ncbi:MAG: hypothetical protein H6718_27665 [Polyangiaceae bacterium]|nr:hypothetical protein [Myxococcales bacterium]MCB9589223.1 hypothetical protein [Polyangiaceae bacterium]
MSRRSPILVWGLGALLALPCCGGEQRKADAPPTIRVGDEKTQEEAEPVERSEVKGVIVWARPDDSEQTTSYWLDPEGNVLKEQPGIFMLAGGKEWEFSKTLGRMPVYECDAVMGDTASAPTDHKETQVPSLIELKTRRSWELWEQPKPGPEERYNDYSQNVGLIASAGRYLVLADFTWVYGCGAHGFSVATYSAYDLERKQKLPLLSPAETNELRGHELSQAVAAFKAAGDGFDEPTEEQVTLINVIPEVTPQGKQQAELVFSIGTCYACTHGEGSSYTATTRVVAETLPRALAEQPLPKAVVRFAGTHPVRGWSAR